MNVLFQVDSANTEISKKARDRFAKRQVLLLGEEREIKLIEIDWYVHVHVCILISDINFNATPPWE